MHNPINRPSNKKTRQDKARKLDPIFEGSNKVPGTGKDVRNQADPCTQTDSTDGPHLAGSAPDIFSCPPGELTQRYHWKGGRNLQRASRCPAEARQPLAVRFARRESKPQGRRSMVLTGHGRPGVGCLRRKGSQPIRLRGLEAGVGCGGIPPLLRRQLKQPCLKCARRWRRQGWRSRGRRAWRPRGRGHHSVRGRGLHLARVALGRTLRRTMRKLPATPAPRTLRPRSLQVHSGWPERIPGFEACWTRRPCNPGHNRRTRWRPSTTNQHSRLLGQPTPKWQRNSMTKPMRKQPKGTSPKALQSQVVHIRQGFRYQMPSCMRTAATR